jgi:hypothetical protein
VCVCLCSPLLLLGSGSVKIPVIARQWLGKNLLIVARQRLIRNVTTVMNRHATIEELLDASFSAWPVLYQGKYAISSFQNFLHGSEIKGVRCTEHVSWMSREMQNFCGETIC